MIVSFSVPRMLPLIWNGLVQINEARPGSVPQVRDRDTCAWIASQRQEVKQFDFERVKRQTIRLITSDHWLKVVENPGRYMLDLYWKNQYAPERRRLATVPCRSAERITIENIDGRALVMPPDDCISSDVAHADGFDSFQQFRDYFVPKPRDRVNGVILRW